MKWYITWNRPKMKAQGGAFWPFMTIRKVFKDGTPRSADQIKNTIRHEEGHMLDQLLMLLIPWYILYGIFHLVYGYQRNPFEVWSRVVAITDEWAPFGWTFYVNQKEKK